LGLAGLDQEVGRVDEDQQLGSGGRRRKARAGLLALR